MFCPGNGPAVTRYFPHVSREKLHLQLTVEQQVVKKIKNNGIKVWKEGFNCLIFAPAFKREGKHEERLKRDSG